jgi:Homeodomain-like domain
MRPAGEGAERNRPEPTGFEYSVANFLPLPNTHFNLYQKLQQILSEVVIPPVVEGQRRPGPKDIPYGMPQEEWPTVLQRVLENHESYRKIAADYGVSRETVRRLVRASKKAG